MYCNDIRLYIYRLLRNTVRALKVNELNEYFSEKTVIMNENMRKGISTFTHGRNYVWIVAYVGRNEIMSLIHLLW